MRSGTQSAVVVAALLVAGAVLSMASVQPTRAGSGTGSRQGTVIAAGDIADCSQNGGRNRSERVAATAAAVAGILRKRPDAVVAALGDNAYRSGTLEEYETCFDRFWGSFKHAIRPAPGNHEYDYAAPNDARGYFTYFGAAAGEPGKGWYSYDIGAWHVIVLNTNGRARGGTDCRWVACGRDSEQMAWLNADLAAHADVACTLAYFHHPRFSSGNHGDQKQVDPIWRALAGNGVDVVLNGHDHHYERWQPRDVNGKIDPAGTREFLVGTGGGSLYRVTSTGRSEELKEDVWGVLRLTLLGSGYDWVFTATPNSPAGPYMDAGAGECH
jgi:hypothetical protein